MAIITVKCDPEGITKTMDNYQKAIIRDLLGLVRKYLKIGTERIKSQLEGNPVKSRSGKLKRSVKPGIPLIKKDEIVGSISIGGPDVPYAGIHISEQAGRATVITPKRAMKLAIPTDFARTPKGIPRGAPRDPIWGITFIAQGIIFGFQRGTKRVYGGARPLFTLKNSVTVVSRVGINPVIDKLRPQMELEAKQILETAAVSAGLAR